MIIGVGVGGAEGNLPDAFGGRLPGSTLGRGEPAILAGQPIRNAGGLTFAPQGVLRCTAPEGTLMRPLRLRKHCCRVSFASLRRERIPPQYPEHP